MNYLSNAHTHTRWCDGRSTAAELVDAARALGFVSLGFSGHGYQGFDPEYSMSRERQAGYLAELRALQARSPAPRVWAGLELDVLAPDEDARLALEQFDYVIGSTHYLCRDWRGQPIAVDGDAASLEAYVREEFAGDGLAMAREYYAIEVEGLLRMRPHVIGHFDLVRKHAARLGLFSASSAAYRRLALEALQRARPACDLLEINTGGMARGYLSTPYPTLELVGAWREMGGRVTLTTDCHDLRYLDYGLDLALALARDAGYKSVARLGAGNALWEDVPTVEKAR